MSQTSESKPQQSTETNSLVKAAAELAAVLEKVLRNHVDDVRAGTETREKLETSKIDRRSGVLRNDAFEDVAKDQLTQIIGFNEKRRDVPNQAIAIQGDIVDFGRYNRQFGHLAGHAVIANAGKILNSFLRPNSKDIAGRLGEGDEFGILIFFRADTPEEVEQVQSTVDQRFYQFIYKAVEAGLIPGFKWRSAVYQIQESYEDFMNRADPKNNNNQSQVYEYPKMSDRSSNL